MAELLSVGLDVGTTTTQLILSELRVENRATGFAVPQMEITGRRIRYRGPVHMTPLTDGAHVDGDALAALVSAEYARAGLNREQVDTGAVIITGETSRKENARQVLTALSGFAGEFVVATAGPDLESVLAAKGAGAVDFSARTGKSVLHMDIGGGTSNLAFVENGKITRTGCLNVGGRLVKLGEQGEVTYVSPVLEGLCDLQVGQTPTPQQLEQVAELLARALEMAAGLLPSTDLLEKLTTREAKTPWVCERAEVISFSGGVADCIDMDHPPLAFGDLGVLLGRAIRRSGLCNGAYRLGEQTIRATVIGAGCHSTQLSGSTIYYDGITLPIKNLPVAVLPTPVTKEAVTNAYLGQDSPSVVLYIAGYSAPAYAQVRELAETIISGSGEREILVCLDTDMAKALGHAIKLLAPERACLCMDRVQLSGESFLDIGTPVGPALPVVVKTLVLSQAQPMK